MNEAARGGYALIWQLYVRAKSFQIVSDYLRKECSGHSGITTPSLLNRIDNKWVKSARAKNFELRWTEASALATNGIDPSGSSRDRDEQLKKKLCIGRINDFFIFIIVVLFTAIQADPVLRPFCPGPSSFLLAFNPTNSDFYRSKPREVSRFNKSRSQQLVKWTNSADISRALIHTFIWPLWRLFGWHKRANKSEP